MRPYALLPLLAFAPHALAQISFAPAVTYPAGTDPRAVVLADFNADGNLDMAYANSGNNNISLRLGNGDGTFRAAVNYNVGTSPNGLAVGDFDRDGDLDLVVTNAGSNNLCVLINNGSGIFLLPIYFATGNAPYAPVVGDFNGDGRPDIATANYLGTSISVLISIGDNSFAPRVLYTTGANPIATAVGDFNRDGKLDIAVTNDSSSTLSIFLGTGTGTFGAQTTFPTGLLPRGVAVGDFNADGRLDLACANYGSAPAGSPNGATVHLGNGSGSFAAPVSYAPANGPRSVAVADFNRDGKPDLAVANYVSNSVSILAGIGNGTFSATTNFPAAGSLPIDLAVGDIDRDGWPDIVVSNYGSDTISVLRNTGRISNNSCSEPRPVINGATMNFSTLGATTDGPTENGLGFGGGDPQVNQDVWFLYTAPCSGVATIDLCGSNFNTKVAVYQGTACPTSANTAIAGNDDSTNCAPSSLVSFPCTQGSQYLIRVGGFTNAAGAVQMAVNCAGTCGSADFDGDGDTGTDADIEAFFRVLSGGGC